MKDAQKRLTHLLAWVEELKTKTSFDLSDLIVETKENGTEVTNVDRFCEDFLREKINKHFPQDGIIGEEFGRYNDQADYVWTLDPIDGTRAFSRGVPLFAHLISVFNGSEVVLGFAHFPHLNETIYATKDHPTMWRPSAQKDFKPAHVSNEESFSTCLFCHSGREYFKTDSLMDLHDEMQAQCLMTRTWGDAYGYLLVATGRADIMLDPSFAIWDGAPLKILIENAGGKFWGLSRQRADFGHFGLACNARLAPLLTKKIELLNMAINSLQEN